MKKWILVIIIALVLVSASVITYKLYTDEEPIHVAEKMI